MGRISHLLTHTVTVASQLGKNSSGDPSFGSQSAISARVEHRTALIRDANGRMVEAQHRVVSEDEIKLSDRVWLPGDDITKTNEARQPIVVGNADIPMDGYTLYEVWF